MLLEEHTTRPVTFAMCSVTFTLARDNTPRCGTEDYDREQKQEFRIREKGIMTTYNCISTKLLPPRRDWLPLRHPR